MAKGTTSVSIETVKVSKQKAEKPTEDMFVSGRVQIPRGFQFTDEQFIKRFAGQKLGKDINVILKEYRVWEKVNNK